MKQSLLFTLVLLSACLPKMRDTDAPASPSTWDTIVANAQQAGYATQRKDEGARDGKYFWYVKATRDGGTIYFTKNNSTGDAAFACDDVQDCDRNGLALINGK